MAEHLTPRIDGTLLKDYENRVCRIIGKVEDSSDQNAISFYTPSLAQDNVIIKVIASQSIELQTGNWYEIIARIQKDLTVRAIDSHDFGTNIDEKAVAGLVKYSHKTSEIFY